MAKQITKFNLDNAFKALDDIEIPEVHGIRPNTDDIPTLRESFVKRNRTDVLVEEYYDVSDSNDMSAAQQTREGDIAKAKLDRIEKIVDLDASSADELLLSYEGKIIIQCPQCMQMFYKNEADLEYSDDDPNTVNVNEPCQHCGNISGYSVIGKVAPATEAEVAELNGEAAPEEIPADEAETANELDLDFGEPTEEVDAEGTGEADTDLDFDDLDLELDLDTASEEGEEEEKTEEAFTAPTGISLTEQAENALRESDEAKYDKELDKKLAAHNEYIDFLRKAIEAKSEEIKKEKNEFVIKLLQRDLENLSYDLNAAIPEEVKHSDDDIPEEEPIAEEPVNDVNVEAELAIEDEAAAAEPVADVEEAPAEETVESLTEETDDEDDYEAEAEKFIKEIANMSKDEVKRQWRDYNFTNNPPADDVEVRIAKALKARWAELKKTEALNESYSTRNIKLVPCKVKCAEKTYDGYLEDPTDWGYAYLDDKNAKRYMDDCCNDEKLSYDIEDEYIYLRDKDGDDIYGEHTPAYAFATKVNVDGKELWEFRDDHSNTWNYEFEGVADDVKEGLKEDVKKDRVPAAERIAALRAKAGVSTTENLDEAISADQIAKFKADPFYSDFTDAVIKKIINVYSKYRKNTDEINIKPEKVTPEELQEFVEDIGGWGTFLIEQYFEVENGKLGEDAMFAIAKKDPKFMKALHKYSDDNKMLVGTVDNPDKISDDYFLKQFIDVNDEDYTYENLVEVEKILKQLGEALVVGEPEIYAGPEGEEPIADTEVAAIAQAEGDDIDAAAVIGRKPEDVDVKVDVVIQGTDELSDKDIIDAIEEIAADNEKLDDDMRIVTDVLTTGAEDVAKEETAAEEEIPADEDADDAAVLDMEESLMNKTAAEYVDHFGSENRTVNEAADDVEAADLDNSDVNDLFDSIESGDIKIEKLDLSKLEDIDEEKLNSLITESLTKVYDNVKTFEATECSIDNQKLIVEGRITFASGAERFTKYTFLESKLINDTCKLMGINESLSKDGVFILEGMMESSNTMLKPTCLKYSYRIDESLVEGTVAADLQEAGFMDILTGAAKKLDQIAGDKHFKVVAFINDNGNTRAVRADDDVESSIKKLSAYSANKYAEAEKIAKQASTNSKVAYTKIYFDEYNGKTFEDNRKGCYISMFVNGKEDKNGAANKQTILKDYASTKALRKDDKKVAGDANEISSEEEKKDTRTDLEKQADELEAKARADALAKMEAEEAAKKETPAEQPDADTLADTMPAISAQDRLQLARDRNSTIKKALKDAGIDITPLTQAEVVNGKKKKGSAKINGIRKALFGEGVDVVAEDEDYFDQF